jgi:hypothetical protein
LGTVLLISFAGTALDKIPVNVYFWFFLGVMLKVPELPLRTPPSGQGELVPRPPGPESGNAARAGAPFP